MTNIVPKNKNIEGGIPSYDISIDESIDESIEESIEKPSDESIEKPSEESIEKPSEESIEKPSDESIENPSEESIENPSEDLAEKQAEDLADISETEYLSLYNNSVLGKTLDTSFYSKIKETCCKIPGIYYCVLHTLLMILIGIIVLFVTNKYHLCMALLVISLDAVANVIFFDCPLSSLEKKYLKTSMIETRLKSLQKFGIMYANNRYYDTQLEVIINGWTMCAGKILFLIIFDSFNIKY